MSGIYQPVGFALSLFVCPFTALGQDVPPRGPVPFAVYDKDGSGAVSEAEFNAVRAARTKLRARVGQPMRGQANELSFSEFDTNKDAQISANELSDGHEIQRQRRLSRGPSMACPNMTFSNFDSDNNGCVTETEFTAARSACEMRLPGMKE